VNIAFNAFFERFVTRSKFLFFMSLFVPLSLLYSATGNWHLPKDFDVMTNAVSAWSTNGTCPSWRDTSRMTLLQ